MKFEDGSFLSIFYTKLSVFPRGENVAVLSDLNQGFLRNSYVRALHWMGHQRYQEVRGELLPSALTCEEFIPK
jgi:hypothetical protein